MNNTFAERMHDGKSRQFPFHWRDNPRFSQQMYDEFLAQWGPVITAQELDMNYMASQEGIVIPAEWINSAIDAHKKLGIEPTGVRGAAFDVADRGIDKNAYAARHGVLLFECVEWSGKGSDIFESVERIFLLCDEHAITQFHYDADGLGAGVRGDARVINERRQGQQLRWIDDRDYRGSGPVSDPDGEMVAGRTNADFFANFKAQSWWSLRARFQATHRAVTEGASFEPDELISIASGIKGLAQLTQELSQPTYSINGAGKILIDKTPQGFRSPNMGDAVCMCFAPQVSGRFFPESALLAR
jgi:phage terminase large subunit